MKRLFVESSVFSKKVEEYGTMMLKEIQLEILRNPEGGDVIGGGKKNTFFRPLAK